MDAIVLEQVVVQQYQQLLRIALTILRQPYDAEDAIQNACLKALRYCSHTEVHTCEAWLRVIVYRECITIIRKRSRYGLLFDAETICSIHSSGNQVMEHLEKQSLRELVESLPFQYSSLIKLRYYEGWNIGEIAQHLNQPTSTIRSSLFRARQMLRAQYYELPKSS